MPGERPDAPLHVVHVLHSLGVGGTENGVVKVVRALQDQARHTVVAMTESGPLATRLSGLADVRVVGKRPGLDPRALGRLVRLLRALRPDVVHSRNWGALDAVLAARLAGVPAVVHGEHGREAGDPRGLDRRRNALRRWIAPLVDRFVAVSGDLAGWLVSTVGVPARKVLAIPNGVDAARFGPAAGPPARLARAPVVGTVGRLDPVKDQARLLDAVAATGDRAVHVVVVGDGPCREALAARARRPDLAGRVHLLGERDDVPALLCGLDVFALPSVAEGAANTLLEAMASGLPVVATRTGGTPEIVEDGVTGRLVPVGDTDALAAALQRYLADPALRARHGEAGRRRVVARFSVDDMARRYGALYRELATRGARRGQRSRRLPAGRGI